MLHHDTLFVTADKLCLKKLLQSTTRLSCFKPLSLQQRGTSCRSTSACLNFFKCYWLPSFPPSPGQLKQQVSCCMPAIAKRRLMQVTEQLGSAPSRLIQFFGCHDRLSSGGLTTVYALRKKSSTPASAVRLGHSTV
jgi:hypothetical protein